METTKHKSQALAVSIQNLTKAYKLYRSGKDRLKEAFNPFGKSYHQEFNALDGLNIDIPKGSTTGIIGRNGSGKSTLLQCICGIVTPSSGKVMVNGKIAALLELGAGFNPEFSGRDNLYINGAILGLSPEQIAQREDAILAFADIGDYIDQPVRAYSSGMFVRLAFAIAIHVDPEVLIVDEALAVGDIHFQAKCFKRFNQFREQGVTVIFVTHDLNMVTQYCDQAYLLSKGNIVSRGAPRDVVAEYRKIEVGFSSDKKPGSQEADKHSAKENENTKLFEQNPYEVRYGNNKAKIIDGGIFDQDDQPVQTLNLGEEFTVRMRVEFDQDVDTAVFAFTIKNAKGTELAGTNTDFAGIQPTLFRKGEIAVVEFTQKMRLNPASYLLSLGCVDLSGEELEIYDRRHEFLSFQVISGKPAVGVVDLESKISIDTSIS